MLSPILFSLYINNLAKEIQVSEIGVVIEDRRIVVLLYADDIVVITCDTKDLQRGLRIATDCGKKWWCSFNHSKSKVVAFGMRRNMNFNWILEDGQLEEMDSYKYLSLDVKNNLRWDKYRD